jgi:hypothetical protein
VERENVGEAKSGPVLQKEEGREYENGPRSQKENMRMVRERQRETGDKKLQTEVPLPVRNTDLNSQQSLLQEALHDQNSSDSSEGEPNSMNLICSTILA